MAERRLRIEADGRTRLEMLDDLDRALDDLRESEAFADVRLDEWRDPGGAEIWVRTVEGPRIRWRLRVGDDGFEIDLRGPFAVRLRQPTALRELVRRLK